MAYEKLILGRYRVLSDAGSGGFGAVKVAWDTTIQRKVAIKIIELSEVDASRIKSAGALYGEGALREEGAPREEGALHEEGSLQGEGAQHSVSLLDDYDPEAFPVEHSLANVPGLDEARTAAMLSDAHIVTVYDLQVQGTTAYLIMEYVEGMTLTRLLRQQGDNLSLNVVAAVFTSVAHALEAAHRNQVLHLDIKPDNVLVNRQGQVKVTDFGLATLADASGRGLAGGGTIGYMPLEQMRQENLDVRCDEWALASLTYEMLTGENPFLARNLAQAEAAIEDAELVLPSLCWEEASPEMDDVMFMALDPEADERYATVTDFAEELEPFLGDAKTGHCELAAMVCGAEGSCEGSLSLQPEKPVRARKPHVPLMDRLGPRSVLVLSRMVAVAASVLLAAVALANVPALASAAASATDSGAAAAGAAEAGADIGLIAAIVGGNPILWGLLLLVALAAAIRPHLGALAAGAALAVSLFMNGAYVVAVLMLAATVAWWYFSARFGAAEADVALALPLFGAFGCAPMVPMMAGCFLPLAQTAIATAYSSFLALVMAGFGSESLMGWQVWAHWDFASVDVQANIVALLLQPATWVVVASWFAAALLFSAFCYRGTRAFDVAGALVASVLLVAGACIAGGLSADAAAGAPVWAQALGYVAPSCVAAVLGVCAAAVGVPDRARWE